jgi:geranylgeranyl diphosphate synthase type 3
VWQGILDPFTYIASHPGNGMRESLLSAFNLWMNVPQGDMEIIAKVVGMLHNASLMCATMSIYIDATC